MRKLMRNSNYAIFFILMAAVAAGCAKNPDTSQIIAEVNNYKVTINDFRQEAAMSMSAESKEQILQDIITKELLLEKAQKMNLDKSKDFMIEIENYWKQALIKRLISIKGNEFLVASKGNNNKTKMENAQAMLESWINGLKNKASIVKHDDMLNKLKKITNKDGGTNAESYICTP